MQLGKKRLKVQRKREHEEDDEAFGPDFESLCGPSGFPSATGADQSAIQPSSIPRFTGRSLSPLSQPQTPQRYSENDRINCIILLLKKLSILDLQ